MLTNVPNILLTFSTIKVTFVQCDVTKQEQFSKYVWFNLFSIFSQFFNPHLNVLRLFDECEAYFKVFPIKMADNGLNLLRLKIENG